MAISASSIYRQVIEVTWEQTVQAVCDEVLNRYPDNPLQTYLCLRHPEGGYAVASLFDLNRKAWSEGHHLLHLSLSQFPDLFPPQPGVELDGPMGDRQAREEAAKYSGRLIVLQRGHVEGCVLNERPAGPGVAPRGAFRLFDPPIPLHELERVPVVVATYDTSVAAALERLQALPTRDQPFALFSNPYREGEWFVFEEKVLEGAVREDERVQGWALAQLGSLTPRKCQAVVYEEVGRKQAEELCADQRCLVVLYAGQPKLLVPDRVLRSAIAYAKGPIAGPQPIPHTVPVQPAARYVNLWFEEPAQPAATDLPWLRQQPQTPQVGHRPQDEPLIQGRTYHLCVDIGVHVSRSIVVWDKEVRPPPIVEPPETKQQQETRLYVSVFSQDFEIEQPTQALTLPPRGSSQPVRFEVRPLRRTFGKKDLAALDVCLYYRCNLVQSFQVQVEVLADGEEPRTKKPQYAVLKVARVEEYPDLDQVGPKELNLTITRRADGAYQFTLTVPPETVQDPRWQAIRLGFPVPLRREDLTHLITKARRQLYNIARSPDYQGSLTGTPTAYQQAMKALATVGRQLYLSLFRLRDQASAGAAVDQWIKEGNLKRDSKIQILDRAGDFVFPWALVYDRSPWEGAEIDLEGFWGVRYQIELLTEGLVERYREVKSAIEAEQVSLSVGLYDYLPGAAQQRSFFEKLKNVAGGQVKTNLFNATPPLRRALQAADQHLVYFFCHGFTERMAADIQLGDDLIAEFKAWFKGLPQEQRAGLQDAITHYDALFDVSDSWLQLTRGTAPLTMMEDTLLAAGARFNNGPLVFLNMCESAQVLPSLSGGFVPFFLDHGARGVIGTECPMTSTFADPFAQEFLRRFFGGQPVGRILLDLRREFLEKGNPLGLAYTLYCDADVRLANSIPVPEVVQA